MFKATITGLNGVQAKFASTSKRFKEIVSSELEIAAENFVSGAVRDAPGDEGFLRNGIGYSVLGDSVSVFSSAFYSPYMEFGTKGKYLPIPGTEATAAQFRGSRGGSFKNLLRNILRWVARKGITGRYSVKTRKRIGSKVNRYAEDYSAAWPIALSILKHGVRPHPYFFKQQEVVWPQMVRNITSRLERDTGVSVILPPGIQKPVIVTI